MRLKPSSDLMLEVDFSTHYFTVKQKEYLNFGFK